MIALDALEEELPLVLLGYSYGGLVAYEVACRLEQHRRPAAGMILVATPPPGVTGELDRLVASSTDEIVSYSRLLYGFDAIHLTAAEIDAYATLLKSQTQAMLDYLAVLDMSLATRSLVIVGEYEEDPELRQGVRRWHSWLSNGSYETLPGGHMLIKSHPDALARRLKQFAEHAVRVSLPLVGAQ